MKYFHSQKLDLKKPVITMGTFDGVHLGHQKLLKELTTQAKAVNGTSIVITYYHHPLETIYRNPFPYLLSEKNSREEFIKALGVDHIFYLNFSEEMSEMEPYEFLQKVLIDEIKPTQFVIGYDTHFGKNRQGDHNFLKKYSEKFNYSVKIIEPFRLNGKIVSSSWCREYIRAGDVEELPKILGRSYCLHGKIIKGNQIGRKIGFPTINLHWQDANKLIPKTGIYLSRIELESEKFWGVTNVGFRPTVIDKSDLTVETHILDFNRNVYGKQVKITFEKRLRPEFKLKNADELIKYIKRDIAEARKIIAQKG